MLNIAAKRSWKQVQFLTLLSHYREPKNSKMTAGFITKGRMLTITTIIFYFFLLCCKKESSEKPPPVDTSGSILETMIDTIWTSPDNSLKLNVRIETRRAAKDSLFEDYRTAFHVSVYTNIISGQSKKVIYTFHYRHFPQDYEEYEASTEHSYLVAESVYGSLSIDPQEFPSVGVYRFIPDPGPIDKLEIAFAD